MNNTLTNSIDKEIKKIKKYQNNLGKKCENCGYRYEEHSHFLELCPNYDTKNYNLDDYDYNDPNREFKIFKEPKSCKKCRNYYHIPTCVLDTPGYFICKEHKTLYECKSEACEYFIRKE